MLRLCSRTDKRITVRGTAASYRCLQRCDKLVTKAPSGLAACDCRDSATAGCTKLMSGTRATAKHAAQRLQGALHAHALLSAIAVPNCDYCTLSARTAPSASAHTGVGVYTRVPTVCDNNAAIDKYRP